VTACVLAGGASLRFGSPKALAPWGTDTMIEAVVRQVRSVCRTTIVVGRHLRALQFLKRPGVQLVRDRFRAQHPLGGLSTGLEAASTPWVFLVACDTPLLQPQLLRALWKWRGAALAVVARAEGRLQPLGALYHQNCAAAVKSAIHSKNLSLQALLSAVNARELPPRALDTADPQGLSFRDADTPLALWALRSLVLPP
jgi:molybdopterin-guanine dinucleotide biosynthesis protein A